MIEDLESFLRACGFTEVSLPGGGMKYTCPGPTRSYTCGGCGGTFWHPVDWTDEDARRKPAMLFGKVPAGDEMVLCDNCYRETLREHAEDN